MVCLQAQAVKREHMRSLVAGSRGTSYPSQRQAHSFRAGCGTAAVGQFRGTHGALWGLLQQGLVLTCLLSLLFCEAILQAYTEVS